ncbi:hypothetical protein L6R52_39045, partial [Myxococcota bacterium]|nr:hypothetical protein [Myxococcota bacterium]
ARALTWTDLDGAAGAADALAVWRRAEGDARAAPQAADQLVVVIRGLAIDRGLVAAKLKRIADRLAVRAGQLAAERYAPLERRYLDLRTELAGAASDDELEALARAASKLEAELASAL